MAEKWRLLELFSRAAFYAGVCYVQAGDLRGAKSMLLHCLVFCEAFRLRNRFCFTFQCFKEVMFCLSFFVGLSVGLLRKLRKNLWAWCLLGA